MSEDKEQTQSSEKPADKAAEPAPETKPARDPVRHWTRIVLIIIVALLAWYLRSDRVTPYTSQAKVHALVVPVAPEVSGIVTSIGVAGNQVVEQGQVLFTLESDSYELAIQNAEAVLATARQSTGAGESGIEAARASVTAAEAALWHAKQDAERMRTIRETDAGAISERRVESAEASLAVAESQLEGAQANLEKAIRGLGEDGDQNSQVQQAMAALEQARLNLERTIIRAPSDGVVTDVRVDKGNFAGAGAAQMTFISSSEIWIQADYKENNLGHLKLGDETEIVFDALPGRVIKGTVENIGFGVDVGTAPLGTLPSVQNDSSWLRAAQRFPVLVRFEISDLGEAGLLKVGSQASVVVYTGEHWLMNSLAWFYVRLISILTYAY